MAKIQLLGKGVLTCQVVRKLGLAWLELFIKMQIFISLMILYQLLIQKSQIAFLKGQY